MGVDGVTVDGERIPVLRTLAWRLRAREASFNVPRRGFEADEPPSLTPHRGLAHRPLSPGSHPSSGKRPQLLRLRAHPSLRDHLSAPDPWLFNVDSRTGSRSDHGDGRNCHTADGSA